MSCALRECGDESTASTLDLGVHPLINLTLNSIIIAYRSLEVPASAQKLADEKNFEIKMYRIGAAAEQVRPPRLVRVAVVQNGIVRPTTDPVKEQVRYLLTAQEFIEEMIHYFCLILYPLMISHSLVRPYLFNFMLRRSD